MHMIGEISKSLKFRYAKDVPGEIVVKIIKRNPFLMRISLKDCKNVRFGHIKKAISLPLRSVKFLNVENCKKINSQSLFTMIQNSPKVNTLNTLGSGVDNQFLLDLNPSVHLKNLSCLTFMLQQGPGLETFVSKYPNLLKLELHLANLSQNIIFHIFKLQNLIELRVFYEGIEYIPSFKPGRSLQTVEILPKDNFTPSNFSFELWDSFTNCSLKHVGTILPSHSLLKLLKFWPEISSIRTCEFFPVPNTVKKLSMYYNDDFDNEIKRNEQK